MPRDFRCVLRRGCAAACGVKGGQRPSFIRCANGVGRGKWRRHKFARVFDGLLCLFPFEPDYFTPLGLDCHFIGHPAAFDIQPKPPVKKPSLDAPQIAILPGSRMSEIKHILPIMLSAVALLRGRFPKAVFTLPAVPRFSIISPQFALTPLSKLLTAIISLRPHWTIVTLSWRHLGR